ncbi:hydroxyacid dehydrogenase [Antribacter gilvus]|uniref:hydroxyacid dehydrogenase n=1 Tax=Antribacter gilvus TaxID=2304675 RepID=UPI000F792CB0|nr:hydroxyacid dehydrogenase [Antribacter gilvus]
MRRPEAMLVMSDETFRTQFGRDELDRLARLAVLGDPLHVTDLDTDQARKRLAHVEVLLTSWGAPALTPERLAAAPGLRAVLHCAGSVRGLVTDAVWERGLLVTNAVDENALPVAEFTFAAIILAGKRVPFLSAYARDRRDDWSIATEHGELSNYGRTVGIVGFSRTGRRVVERLAALETREVLVADPYADPVVVAAAGARLVPLDELLAASDICSLHVPALPETSGMIGGRELALLPDGATLINTARGVVVDTEALERECVSGRLYAMLDVTEPEPLPASSVLYDLPNVMITPHVAGSLGSETRRMTGAALDELELYARGAAPRAAVTRADLRTAA